MSAYMVLACDFTSQETLIAALVALGLTPQVHSEAVALKGYRGDTREETAEIIIPRQQLNARYTGVSNDLGFKWNEESGKYDAICSEYDNQRGIVERISQAYIQNAIQQLLESRHFTFEQTDDSANATDKKRGVIKLVARTMI